jgi:hypothetical protein
MCDHRNSINYTDFDRILSKTHLKEQNQTQKMDVNPQLKKQNQPQKMDVNPYLKYTIYGKFNNNVCGRRCKTLVSNKLFQKCSCK